MAGQRTVRAAGAALVLGLSLAGPQAAGVAAADSEQPDTTQNASAAGHRGTAATAREPRPTRPAKTTRTAQRRSATAPIAPAAARPADSARRDATTPAVTQVPAAPPAAVPTPALPGAAAVAPPADTGPAAAVADIAPAATPVLTSAVVNPVRELLNTIGQLLTDLPATPMTDFLTGSLWLARRTLTSIELAVGGWGPTACACTTSADNVATVLTVTSAADGTAGSLRNVLAGASDGDVIRFAPTLRHATLMLTEGELDIDNSVRIEGTGQTLDAAGQSRIMRLDEAGTAISLSGLTFANGSAPGDPAAGATAGGAILAQGVTLAVCGSTFTANSAVSAGAADPESSVAQYGLGGAIAAIGATLSVHDSVFTANTAVGADNDTEQQASGGLGGAIYGEESEIVLLRSHFTGNSAVGGSGTTPIETFPTSDGGWGAGGAVFTVRAGLSASEVVFTCNTATGGDGLDGSVDNPYGNEVGGGGNASGGALWMQGRGTIDESVAPLNLDRVVFEDNSATGGSAGAQGSATLSTKQGGRAVGGALGAADWAAVSMADVSFADNLAEGGGVGRNAADSGSVTGTGGVGEGGAAFLESPSSLNIVRLSVRDNTALGGQGANSLPDSGTEAGEGGFAYGGGVFLNNATGGLHEPVVIPVLIRDAEIVGNRAIGGEKGEGPVPEDGLGAGGLAQGGGWNMKSVFSTQMVGIRFIGNAAISGQGKFAAGGGLVNPYGAPAAGVDAHLLVVNSFFRDNSAVGGDDAANEVYRDSGAGGFLHNGAGTVISGSRFEGNTVIGGNDTGSGHVGSATGGAIHSLGQNPTITIFDTDFVGNTTLGGVRTVAGESLDEPVSGEARGGAVSSENGVFTVVGGSFVGNAAVVRAGGDRVASGGAIDIPEPVEGYLSYLNTTAVRFLANTAASPAGHAQGGGVAFDGTGYADNGSTFAANTARAGRDGSAYGGALFLAQTSRLSGTTVLFNRAGGGQGFGGGVALPNGAGVLTRWQTTITLNCATTAGDDVWTPASGASTV